MGRFKIANPTPSTLNPKLNHYRFDNFQFVPYNQLMSEVPAGSSPEVRFSFV
jgi:hypothetical protein